MPISNTIPNTGKIHTIIKDIHQGQGSRKIPALLDKIVKEFAIASRKYIDIVGEAPYGFGEMQLSGLLVPGLVKHADAFLSECPILRKNKKTKIDTSGRVDFWIRYEDFDLYMEVKHDYDAFSTDNIKDRVFQKWDEANNFQNSRIKEHAKAASVNPDKVYTISLAVVTVYDKDKDDENVPSYKYEEMIQIQKNYFTNLESPKPNWSALWQPHDRLISNSYWELESNYQYYPGVIFLAKIQKI